MLFFAFLIHLLHGVVSKPDGSVIATAAGQVKTFGSSDHKKMQKFSGHPVSLRSYILSLYHFLFSS